MAEFKISRIRYTWKGDWTTSTSYQKDDVVGFSGSSYVCIRAHTSSSFEADQNYIADVQNTDPSPAWVKMTDGYTWRSDWQASTLYSPGEVVLYGGYLYLCIASHTSTSTFAENNDKWEKYIDSISWTGDWTTDTRYGIGDLVRYNGIVYNCVEEHTSNSNNSFGLEADQSKWEIYYEAEVYIGNWTTGIRYRVNDLVRYNGSLWVCIEGHTSGSDSDINFDTRYWNVKLPGFQYNQDWDSNTTYTIGDIVKYGGYLFYSLTDNYNRSPFLNIYQTEDYEGPLDWQILSKGINFRGLWSSSSDYKVGDVVRRGGNLYVAILDTTADGSTLDYLDETNWEILNTGLNHRGYHEFDVAYQINDVVTYFGEAYKCLVAHTSSPLIVPNIPIIDSTFYWEPIARSVTVAGLNTPGDLLTFDINEDVIETTRIRIGDPGQLVTISDTVSERSIRYKDYAQINRVFYVSLDGIDDLSDTQRGSSPFKPWRTIKFAAEQADDDFAGTTTINVDTGVYEEVLPISIPARTVVLGSELRSTTIKPNPPTTELTVDGTRKVEVLTRINNIIESVLFGIELIPPKTPSNPLNPTVVSDVTGNPLSIDLATAIQVQDLIDDLQAYINFYLNNTGTASAITGTNSPSTDTNKLNAVTVLNANKEFLASEAVAYIQEQYPDYIFNEELLKNQIRRYISAWSYDIVYTGNYKTTLEGRFFRNLIQGSLTEDMFYCRDTTGVRDCTLEGLTGTLSPAGVFDVFQRPTGGAYCSLDPGWGPDDDRCWIINRSPYIQGVTTIGTACIGQKIDGALHNGGNKSMVSNDFTQVISDGIGAWVAADARAELVSVFSYYAQVGYYAQNGGIIRSTNGNNSYGRYGAISDGVDSSEVLNTATINNRDSEAVVNQVVAGDFANEIQILEFSNAGQNYTSASAEIIGSGVNAEVVFEDFRDNAMFEALLIDTTPDDEVIQTIGGSGYSIVQNNSQTEATPGDDDISIVLAASENAFEAEIIGKRIIITSGAGTGQYGFITAFNEVNKRCSVSKESTGEPGWDNVVPGLPNTKFNNTTRYRIEPRLTFSAPNFEVFVEDGVVTNDWIDSVYGETYEVYNNIPSAAGTGTTIDVASSLAQFDIIKNGRTYEVEIVESATGAGYAVGDELTIPGSSLGGITGAHDLIITVTEVSDDSTNSILDFTFEGTGASGKFVIISSLGSGGIYSPDGITWTAFNLPSENDWTRVAAGGNKFVAVKRNSDKAAYSRDGINWQEITLPASRNWDSIIYGGGIFLAVASNQNTAAFSSNGLTWQSVTIPTAGDSSFDEFVDIAYGKNKFVLLANSGNNVVTGEYNSLTGTFSWNSSIMDVIADSSQKDWISIAYGNNRFVALSTQGDLAYSFNSEIWYPATAPTQDGSTAHNWKQIRYGQGVFFAIGDTGGRTIAGEPSATPTTFAATSPDGIYWTNRTLSEELNWTTVTFGNPYVFVDDSSVGLNTPLWIVAANNSSIINRIRTGAQALGRVTVISGVIQSINIWDPGSGYRDNPTVTITDPNVSTEAGVEPRTADGVLANPSWINRGLGYRTISTRVEITGDGFADIVPVGKNITLENLDAVPGPGTQLLITGIDEFFSVQQITELPSDNGIKVALRISPELKVKNRVAHGTSIRLRSRYSSCRITGHDFLDIGTGNFEETNYPELYSGLFDSSDENEVEELNGGRVFYTSTDQSGNFRTGELFAVEQATGIVTISSDFFDFSGLDELRLGGIRVGGTGAVIREFSTDPTFTEDSNNVVPTQRAIAAYLESRLSIGGSEIATASFIAGTVRVGPDFIGSAAGLTVVFPTLADFSGDAAGISGSMLAQTLFFKSFNLD